MRYLKTPFYKVGARKHIAGMILLLSIIMLLSISANAQKQWWNVGAAGFTSGAVEYTTIDFDANNDPYVAFTEVSNGYKATVMKYNGTSWTVLGGSGFSAGATKYTSLVIDNNSTPYVAYKDLANNGKASVMKYNGTSWIPVGSAGFTPAAAEYVSLAIDNNGVPYVGYCDSANGGMASVMKFDGVGWVMVGSAGFSFNAILDIRLAIDSKNRPFAAYVDNTKGEGFLEVYDGAQWVLRKSNINWNFSNMYTDFVGFQLYNDTPYVCFEYVQLLSGARVLKVDSTITYPNAVLSNTTVSDVRAFCMDSKGKPYIAIADTGNNSKASAFEYVDTTWTSSGYEGFSIGKFEFMSLKVDNNDMPYVVYQDSSRGNRATVMNLKCPPEYKANICAAYIDTLTNLVTIAWDNSIPHIKQYTLYREVNGGYSIATIVNNTVSSYVDVAAHASSRSYKYKLVAEDSCGRKKMLDSIVHHKTMLLQFNGLFNKDASITLFTYEGIPNPLYRIKRSNNGAPFVTIDSLSLTGAHFTYIDKDVPAGINRYRVDVPITGACPINKITSNIVTAWPTGVQDVKRATLSITPNPASSELYITSNELIGRIEVYNITGTRLLLSEGQHKKETIVNVSNLPSGVYLLKVNGIHSARFIKQ